MIDRVLHQGWPMRTATQAAGVSVRTGYKWLARFRTEGAPGLMDRSSRPHRSPAAYAATRRAQIESLRHQRQSFRQIAALSQCSLGWLSRHFKRLGLSRLKSLDAPVPVQRYERSAPGELLHLDTKKLGRIRGVGHRITGQRLHRNRGIGWDLVHLAIDDHSRVSFARIRPDESGASCVQFLRDAVVYYASLGVRIDQVMTDNGSGYVSKAFRSACLELGIKHIRTRPYTPRTNGKAERFVQTSLREWAYAYPYQSSAHREAALQPFIERYNWLRPHSALNHQPPMSRIPAMNNLLKLHT